MPFGIKTKTTGGRRLRGQLARAKRAQRGMVDEVRVGFFASSRYPDGTPVTNVAAWNEFGTSRGIPERPFMRLSARDSRDELRTHIKQTIDPKTMAVSQQDANRMGALLAFNIQRTIKKLREPPNSPVTIARKGGKSNPLINTGQMVNDVTYKTGKR